MKRVHAGILTLKAAAHTHKHTHETRCRDKTGIYNNQTSLLLGKCSEVHTYSLGIVTLSAHTCTTVLNY